MSLSMRADQLPVGTSKPPAKCDICGHRSFYYRRKTTDWACKSCGALVQRNLLDVEQYREKAK